MFVNALDLNKCLEQTGQNLLISCHLIQRSQLHFLIFSWKPNINSKEIKFNCINIKTIMLYDLLCFNRVNFPLSRSYKCPWFLYQMVAHFTMRTHRVKQEFRFVEGIWLHRKSRQTRFFFRKKTFFSSSVRNVK